LEFVLLIILELPQSVQCTMADVGFSLTTVAILNVTKTEASDYNDMNIHEMIIMKIKICIGH